MTDPNRIKPSANLSGADLRSAGLSDADLSDADLCGADLSDADLCGANLSGANLSGAYLLGADLCGANLSGANLRGADLSDADLCGVDLSGAKLLGTRRYPNHAGTLVQALADAGACTEAILWAWDADPDASIRTVYEAARKDWKGWLGGSFEEAVKKLGLEK